jgi:hypothetical protein
MRMSLLLAAVGQISRSPGPRVTLGSACLASGGLCSRWGGIRRSTMPIWARLASSTDAYLIVNMPNSKCFYDSAQHDEGASRPNASGFSQRLSNSTCVVMANVFAQNLLPRSRPRYCSTERPMPPTSSDLFSPCASNTHTTCIHYQRPYAPRTSYSSRSHTAASSSS